MDEKERAQLYVVRFIDEHGGPEQIAKHIDMNRQTVRQIHVRRNYPGFDFITKLMSAYPDFDLRTGSMLTGSASGDSSDIPYADLVDELQDEPDETAPTLTKMRPTNKRLFEFVTANGGPSVVAKRIGKHPQLFYNLRDDKNAPSYETLMDIHNAYPDRFDLMYVMTGQRSGTSASLPATSAPDPVLVIENQSLKRENESLQKTVDLLRDVVATQLGKDLKKTESANQSTLPGQLSLKLTGLRKVSNRPRLFDVRTARPAKAVYTGR